jgi:nucleotide-binding universal stress UspA family protein
MFVGEPRRSGVASRAMYRNIVAALDGSTRSPAVLAKALELARLSGGKVHLCRAMSIPIDLPALTWALRGEDLGAFLVDHGQQELRLTAQQAAGLAPEGTIAGVHCRLGKPWAVICEVAAEQGADLIILGSHGFDGIDHLIGTNAARVVDRAGCSVLVVR